LNLEEVHIHSDDFKVLRHIKQVETRKWDERKHIGQMWFFMDFER